MCAAILKNRKTRGGIPSPPSQALPLGIVPIYTREISTNGQHLPMWKQPHL